MKQLLSIFICLTLVTTTIVSCQKSVETYSQTKQVTLSKKSGIIPLYQLKFKYITQSAIFAGTGNNGFGFGVLKFNGSLDDPDDSSATLYYVIVTTYKAIHETFSLTNSQQCLPRLPASQTTFNKVSNHDSIYIAAGKLQDTSYTYQSSFTVPC